MMAEVKWWWKWLIIYILKYFVRSQVPPRNNIGHSFYNNYHPNNYQNLQVNHPTFHSNNYYSLQRRPYAATGAQRALNMVDYHSRVGYMNAPMHLSHQPKVHSIIYANRINPFGGNRIDNSRNYWADWSIWSKCSKPCNGGVKTRIRVCKSRGQYSNYIPNGGASTECVGYRRGYQACNTQVCLTKVQMHQKKYKDRELQCAQHNNIQYHGETYKWIPYMRAGLSECKLNCLADGHRIFKSFGNVKDGNLCGHKDGYSCKSGLCKKTKDNPLHSKQSTKNSSGGSSNMSENPVQPENNKSKRWIYVKKDFEKANGMRVGYNHVLRLPRGAVNITIKDQVPSLNFFALKIGKLFILNGRWQIKSNKLFYAASSIFRYIITRTEGKTLERIFSPGPLSEEVDVMVLYRRSIINITYEYTIPRLPVSNTLHYQLHPSSSHQSIIHGVSHFPPQRSRYQQARLNSAPTYGYNSRVLQPKAYRRVVPHLHPGRPKPVQQQVIHKWQIGGITKCTAKCNGGEQEYTYRCFASMRTSGKFVEDSKCQHVERLPPKKRICNLQACPVKWVTNLWSKCSKACGRNNTQHRTAVCKEYQVASKPFIKVEVNSSLCSDVTKPILVRECEYTPCKYNWKVAGWQKCSTSCDYGVQLRHVYCQSSDGMHLPQENCEELSKPDNTRKCLKAHCSADWFVSEWSLCTSACGEGIQSRTILCRSSSGLILSNSFCQSKKKPLVQKTCTGSTCKGGFWVTTSWTKCSRHCGSGNQYRKVFCTSSNGNGFAQVSDNMCSSSKPNDVKHCKNKNCKPLWYISNWEKCSATCGRGIQRRQRVCMSDDGKLGRGCYYKSRPTLMQFCTQPSCSKSFFKISQKRSPLRKLSSTIQRKYQLHPSSSGRLQQEKPIIPVNMTPRHTTTTASLLTKKFSQERKYRTSIKIKNEYESRKNISPGKNKETETSLLNISKTPEIFERKTAGISNVLKRDTVKHVGFKGRVGSDQVITSGRSEDSSKSALRSKVESVTSKRRNTMRKENRLILSPRRIKLSKSIVHTTQPTETNDFTTEAIATTSTSTIKWLPTTRDSTTIKKVTTRNKKITVKKVLVNRNSSLKVIAKTKCFDFYSKAYCKISVRLKLCRLKRYRRLCCTSCRGK